MSNILFTQGLKRNNKNISNVDFFSLVPFKEVVHKDSIKVVSYSEIPFNSLQFVKHDDGYLARYQISIGIKNQKGIDLSHKVWSDSIKINKYLNTKSNLRNRKHFFFIFCRN
jgi:hypothetical protein